VKKLDKTEILDFLDGSFTPLNSGYEEYDPHAQEHIAGEVMDVLGQMIENATIDLRVHMPMTELMISHNPMTQNLSIIARGFRVFETEMDLLAIEPSVSCRWLMWPPPPAPGDMRGFGD